VTPTPSDKADVPAARFAVCRTRELRERHERRDLATRTVARLIHDPQGEVRPLSIVDQPPGAGSGTQDLELALAAYARRVAEQVGVPAEAVTYEVTDTATAYLGLTARTADVPHRDLMLIWDERLGWYIAVEPCGNDHPPVICHLGGQIAPSPATVARFVAEVLDGRRRAQLGPGPSSLDRATLAAQMAGIPA
jgi:hypothetical protein